MPACENCSNHVTQQYARVFGDNQDVVYACPDCADAVGGSRERAGNGEVPA